MAVASAPTSFTALLRRSKFASYDPLIAQVYTSFDGDAHRGNWGLKRPLPLRRRGACITVRSVDSRAQQTEWKSAEEQARWVKMWQEQGRQPQVDSESPWYPNPRSQSWEVDTEFGRPSDVTLAQERANEEEERIKRAALLGKEKKPPRLDSGSIPNVRAMDSDQFVRYIERLRSHRAEFAKFVGENPRQRKNSDSSSTLNVPQQRYRVVQRFLGAQASSDYAASTSRSIEHRPHPNAGLGYAHVPPLQAFVASKPVPARIIASTNKQIDYRESDATYERMIETRAGANGKLMALTVGGLISRIRNADAEGVMPLKLSPNGVPPDERAKGTTLVRLNEAEFTDAPSVVGRDASGWHGLGGLKMYTMATGFKSPPTQRSNDLPPGSREYVAKEGATMSKTNPIPMHFGDVGARRKAHSQDLMRSLTDVPEKKRQSEEALIGKLRDMLIKPKSSF